MATGTWTGLVSLPSKIMPLSIGSFHNRFPVGPYPPLHGLAFLQPSSFCDIWDLSDSLSSRVALSFQWVPSHAGLPGNKLADSLAKTGATFTFAHVPCPLALTIAMQKLGTLATRFGDEIFLTTPYPGRFLRFPRRNWPFPSHPL